MYVRWVARKRKKKEQSSSGVRGELFAKLCLQVDKEVKAGRPTFQSELSARPPAMRLAVLFRVPTKFPD